MKRKLDRSAVRDIDWSKKPKRSDFGDDGGAWSAALDRWIPEVEVSGVHENPSFPGSWIVTIRCAYCGYIHTHGHPDADFGRMTTRVSHCWTGPGIHESYKFTVYKGDTP